MDGNCHRDYDSRRDGNPPSLVTILWMLSILWSVTLGSWSSCDENNDSHRNGHRPWDGDHLRDAECLRDADQQKICLATLYDLT